MEQTVSINPAVKEAGADVATDLKTVIRDIQTLLKSAAANGTEMASSVRSQLESALQKLQTQLADLEKAAAARAAEAGRATEAYVRENPWRALGAAAGVGLVVGMLISRR